MARPGWRSALDVAASLAMLGAAAVVFFRVPARSTASPPPPEPPAEILSVADTPLLGRVDAPLTLVIFSDFECPFCARVAKELLPALESVAVRDGRLRVAFRHFPLPLHKFALPAAEASECAASQNRFWPMHDAIFGLGPRLDEAAISSAAQTAGLDTAFLATCLANRAAQTSRVLRDVELGKRLGVRATPTAFLGKTTGDGVLVKRVLSGLKPVAEIVDAMEQITR